MIAGELAAVHVTFVGHANPAEQRLTALAVLAGVFGVATPILNTVIKITTASLNPFGDDYERFALRCGVLAITTVHFVLYALAAVVLVAGVR